MVISPYIHNVGTYVISTTYVIGCSVQIYAVIEYCSLQDDHADA